MRRFRVLLYHLDEVGAALRSARLEGAADQLRQAQSLLGRAAPAEFLDASRSALEDVLLGERDLPAGLIGAVLETLGVLDELFAKVDPTDASAEDKA